MAEIVSLAELASFLRVDQAAAGAYQPHLNLAQGLVIDEVGVRDPWPATAKTVVLAAVARAYYNPEGLRSEQTGGHTAVRDAGALGVFLTDDERLRLQRVTGGGLTAVGPVGEFPDGLAWPDPIQ